MSMLINPYKVRPSFTFEQTLNWVGVSPSLLTPVTVEIGPAVAKHVIFAWSWFSNGALTSTTLKANGVAVPRYSRAIGGTSQSRNIEICRLHNTELTEAELSVEWVASSGTMTRSRVGIFFTPPSYTDQNGIGESSSSSGTTLTDYVQTLDDGYLIAAAQWLRTDATSVTWTGATEVYDNDEWESYAIVDPTTADASYDVSVALSAARTNRTMMLYAAK